MAQVPTTRATKLYIIKLSSTKRYHPNDYTYKSFLKQSLQKSWAQSTSKKKKIRKYLRAEKYSHKDVRHLCNDHRQVTQPYSSKY
jgi:hypothetical protein